MTIQNTLSLTYSSPASELITRRFSCRKFKAQPIPEETQTILMSILNQSTSGIFGTRPRFGLISASQSDSDALRGLGTYGFIRQPAGFVVGARQEGEGALEDFGLRMEEIVLAITDLGLGSCWLGGTFTKSSFAARFQLEPGQSIPAILAIGMIDDEQAAQRSLIRSISAGHRRFPWQELFYDQDWGNPLLPSRAGDYALPLELLRLAPSASNKQPWRVVLQDGTLHFFLQRSKGYRNVFTHLMQIEDLQRIDMGIAICHFLAGAREAGIAGKLAHIDHAIEPKADQVEYLISWLPA